MNDNIINLTTKDSSKNVRNEGVINNVHINLI